MGRRKILMWDAAKYELFIVGEQLRIQMTEDSQVKDRRYHLRKYRKCVIGREVIDWLVKRYHVQSREEAVRGMQILQEHGLIHHVVDEHEFKDQHLFYRFSYDDNSYKLGKDLASFYRGIDIYRILKVSVSNVMRDFYHKGIHYKEAFYGSDAVDCVTAAEGFPDRDGIIKDFRDLLEKDIIKHVTDDYHFSYDRLIYEFNLDFQKPCLLHDVLEMKVKPKSNTLTRGGSESSRGWGSIRGRGSSRSSKGHDSLLGTSAPLDSEEPFELVGRVLLKGSKKGIDVPRDSLDSGMGASNESNASNSPPGSAKDGDDTFSLASQTMEPRSVLIRPVTLEELEDPDAPIVKRFLQVQRDEIGFGFVLRGSSPCYVQAVDPLGPAAKAGMKVRQFISHINGDEVIRMDHKEVSHIVAKLDVLNILILMHRTGDRIS